MLIDKIKRQLKSNSGKNLFYQKLEDVFEVTPLFIKELQLIKNSPDLERYESEIENLINTTVDLLVKEIYDVNQFVNISKQKFEEAKRIYRETWESIKQKDSIEKVLYSEHYPKLSTWLAGIYPESFVIPISKQKMINRIVCKEYSAEFQLSILNLIPSDIKEPVLDIGCGENANLVNYLRDQSKEAFGFDRLIISENKYLEKTTWSDYEFGINKWGTIISNMALSNNFTYAANYEIKLLDDYKKLYLKILSSLVLGGIFIYAPSFKMFEDDLDKKKYSVKNTAVLNGFYFTKIIKISL